MGNQLSQAAQRLDLAWTQGDPVSLSFIWPDDNLTGSWTAHVQDAEREGSTIKSLTVTATYNPAEGTTFNLVMSQADSALVPIGNHWWSLTRVNGATLLAGRVNVGDGRHA